LLSFVKICLKMTKFCCFNEDYPQFLSVPRVMPNCLQANCSWFIKTLQICILWTITCGTLRWKSKIKLELKPKTTDELKVAEYRPSEKSCHKNTSTTVVSCWSPDVVLWPLLGAAERVCKQELRAAGCRRRQRDRSQLTSWDRLNARIAWWRAQLAQTARAVAVAAVVVVAAAGASCSERILQACGRVRDRSCALVTLY